MRPLTNSYLCVPAHVPDIAGTLMVGAIDGADKKFFRMRFGMPQLKAAKR
jgi:hypothetical protein